MQKDHPLDSLVRDILEKVDQSKVSSLVEKCLVWMKGQRNSSIRLCGYSFLRLILAGNEAGNPFISKNKVYSEGCLSAIEKLFKE